MAYKTKTIKSNKANYGGSRSVSDIKYIVIHYTANKTDKAVSNGNYFKNNVVKASAHYFIDDTMVVTSVKPNYVAWAVGGHYSDSVYGGGEFYGKCTNANSVSVELCCTNYGFSDATIDIAVVFVKELMKKYNVPVSRVIRHMDVNRKVCPLPFIKDEKAWNKFKNRLVDKPTTSTFLYKVTVNATSLRYRSKASTVTGKVLGSYANGKTVKIIKENAKGTWGKTSDGWICLKYTSKI